MVELNPLFLLFFDNPTFFIYLNFFYLLVIINFKLIFIYIIGLAARLGGDQPKKWYTEFLSKRKPFEQYL